MSTTYVAHIITTEATMFGDPELIITTGVDPVTGQGDPIATYPLTADGDPYEELHAHGWFVLDPGRVSPDTGYVVAIVEPADPEEIIAYVTHAKAKADTEARRQEAAWRTLIANTVRDRGSSAARIAAAAGISRERVYQIRDNRR